MSHADFVFVRRFTFLSSKAFAPLLLLLASAAWAQTSDDAEAVELQRFVVTGSNIRRLDLEKIAPITVLDQNAMQARNAILPADMLTALPSIVNLPENETRLGSSGARGDNANINMRNLGATATLVLIDGRRMAVNPMTAGLSQAVNVNQLPVQGIERIEVLRDGASSIYGSDAVGGVINYVMRRNYVGSEAQVRYLYPEAGGGQTTQASIMYGTKFADGKARIFGTVDSLYRDAIFLRDRDFSSTSQNYLRAPAPFNVPGSAFDARITRGYYPTFRIGSSTTSNYLRLVDGVPTLTSTAPTRATNPEFYLDLNPFGMAAPRVRRGDAFLSAEYDVTSRVTLFTDFSFYKARSTMRRQPIALNAPTTDKLAVMSADNPYNPYGSSFYDPNGAPTADGRPRLVGTPRSISFVSFTPLGVAPESVETNNKAYRFTAGAKGSLGESWKWEAAGFYNKVTGRDNAFPDIRESVLTQALQRTDATAYNPFGYTFKVQGNTVVVEQPYTNSAATVSSFTQTYSRNAESTIGSGDVRATGKLLSIWTGDIQTAAGLEYRRETLSDTRPQFHGENGPGSSLDPLDNDFLLHPPRPDVFGHRHVTSAYLELSVPLVAAKQEIPLINTLELSASGRHERYSDFGNTTKPKVGLNWRPLSWLMLRGSYNEGFVAPSLAALFTSPRWSITAGAGDIDDYRNPVTKEGAYVQRTYFGGNPNLKAAESKGETYGAVIDVPFVKGLSFTIDYWHIDRTNLLGQRSPAQIRASDAALLNAYTKAQLAAGVPVDKIDLGSGTANYKGDPDVVRFAVTPEDIATYNAYNAANPTAPQAVAGKIFSTNQPFINLSTSENQGVDLSARYQLPNLRIGSFAVDTDWSYLAKSRSTIAPANLAPTINDDLGVNGAARWRGTTTLTWRFRAWTANVGAYYIGRSEDSNATTNQATFDSLGQPGYLSKHYTGGQFVYRYVMSSSITYNLSLAYRFRPQAPGFLSGLTIRGGVNNVFDKAPPLSSDQFGYSPSVNQSLVLGRTWTIEVSKKF